MHEDRDRLAAVLDHGRCRGRRGRPAAGATGRPPASTKPVAVPVPHLEAGVTERPRQRVAHRLRPVAAQLHHQVGDRRPAPRRAQHPPRHGDGDGDQRGRVGEERRAGRRPPARTRVGPTPSPRARPPPRRRPQPPAAGPAGRGRRLPAVHLDGDRERHGRGRSSPVRPPGAGDQGDHVGHGHARPCPTPRQPPRSDRRTADCTRAGRGAANARRGYTSVPRNQVSRRPSPAGAPIRPVEHAPEQEQRPPRNACTDGDVGRPPRHVLGPKHARSTREAAGHRRAANRADSSRRARGPGGRRIAPEPPPPRRPRTAWLTCVMLAEPIPRSTAVTRRRRDDRCWHGGRRGAAFLAS